MNSHVPCWIGLRGLAFAGLTSLAFALGVPMSGKDGGTAPYPIELPSRLPPQHDANSWTWRIAPYIWMTDIDGTVKGKNAEVDFNVDFNDIWDNLGGAGLLLVEANKGQFAVLSDLIYLNLSLDGKTPTGADADAEVDTFIGDLVGLYRISPTSPFEIGLGARYASIQNDLDVGVNSADVDRDTIDGFAAGRATFAFATRWTASVYGDIGAGNSDLTWQAAALLRWQSGNWGLGGGYRALGYEVDDGSKELDFTIHGFVFGAEFQF